MNPNPARMRIVDNRLVNLGNKYQREYYKLHPFEIRIRSATKYLLRRNLVDFEVKECSDCGSKKNLHVHHVSYTVNPKDWLVLCAFCHSKIHKIDKKVINKEEI